MKGVYFTISWRIRKNEFALRSEEMTSVSAMMTRKNSIVDALRSVAEHEEQAGKEMRRNEIRMLVPGLCHLIKLHESKSLHRLSRECPATPTDTIVWP